jgi:2-keto-4-pentenoate hydratase/2-oxohepta-3-ene-1,7-dioic acid hydratase in catechol pathway
MRLATAEAGGEQHILVIAGEGDGCWNAAHVFPGFPGGMIDLIKEYPNPARLRAPREAEESIRGYRLLAPIPSPERNVFCVGKNYHEHAREFQRSGFDSTKEEAPPLPSFFTKPASSVIGPNAMVHAHRTVTSQMDYENELAVVIGKGGRGIKRADAYGHIFGYTIVNDVTARDLQKQARQWFLGKCLDTFCPMGPWIVTADEIDPTNLELSTWINGELRQHANTRDLIFDIPTLIEVLSAGMALNPGDIISTGTAAGVGIGFDPPKFLNSGDEMKLEISGIGSLINTVE